MFRILFKDASTVVRYSSAPLARSRVDYLEHCAGLGYRSATLKHIAAAQLAIARHLEESEDGQVSSLAIQQALQSARRSNSSYHRVLISCAIRWLRFAGLLEESAPECRFGKRLAAFTQHLKSERGLAESSIHQYHNKVRAFLKFCLAGKDEWCEVTLADAERFLLHKGHAQHCSRMTISGYVNALRAFFRHEAVCGRVAHGVAEALMAPHIYRHESVPLGPSAEQIQQLLASTDSSRGAAPRDRAILLLLSVYGLRAGEVCRLQLTDIDWQAETIRVHRAKTERVDRLPLTATVGDAIIRYLQQARPACTHSALFLAHTAPLRPFNSQGVSSMVINRMRSIGINDRYRGAHSLRHAFAQRLLDQRVPMNTIRECLGHQSIDTTAVYAKVGLTDLREVVADFDLEEVLP